MDSWIINDNFVPQYPKRFGVQHQGSSNLSVWKIFIKFFEFNLFIRSRQNEEEIHFEDNTIKDV